MKLGIDFGTTHTAVAWADRGNYPVLTFENVEGDPVDAIPSMAAELDGTLHFGLEAQALVTREARAVPLRSFKRVLSSATVTADTPVQIGAVTIPALELVTRFLISVGATVRERLGSLSRRPQSGALEAVVAVPANAFGAQRFLTLDAFRRAGFDVKALLNEPSAAGFEYVHRHADTLSSRRTQVVVYDLGGGTFDASLVHVASGQHEVVTTAGLNDLGGDDLDQLLMHLALAELGIAGEGLSHTTRARLIERCREAKERLTVNSRRVLIDLEGLTEMGEGEVSVPVPQFYEAATPLVKRSLDVMEPVVAAARRGEEDELAGVYVVGGGSALPLVARMLRERFGRRLHRSPYPSAATAIGLAIAADAGKRATLSDRMSRHFGVFREGNGGSRIVFDPIFPKDAPLPKDGTTTELTRTYRPAHNIGHLRFVECQAIGPDGAPRGDVMPFADLYVAYDRTLRGSADLKRVPIARFNRAPLIEERYRLDADGLVGVTVTDLETGWQETHRLGS